MSWLTELRTSALLGTGRHPAPTPPVDLGVCPPDAVSPEALLLDQAALADVATRAARVAGGSDHLMVRPAGADDCPAAPPEAARLLELLLNQPPVGKELRDHLVQEWLRTAAAAGRRVPHRLLPALLALAGSRPSLAGHLHPAIGARGLWLQELRRDTSLDGTGPEDPVATAERPGSAEDFETLRRLDPARAREQLAAEWKSLTARERAARLGAFAENLQADDEPLLEAALDDRAKSVRETAVELLNHEPASARAARMAARLEPLLQVKRLPRKHFQISLPGVPDDAAVRDGVPADPRTGHPDRVAQFHVIIRGAPLEVWTRVAGGPPATVLGMLRSDSRIIDSLATTAGIRGDLPWIRALLDLREDAELLGHLPGEEREQHLVRLLKTGSTLPATVFQLLHGLPRPWGGELSTAVLDRILTKDGGTLAAGTASFLPLCLTPETLKHRALRHEPPDDDACRRVLGDITRYHSIRRSLTEAFR
ncbi:MULTISPECIES: DUF5691 domain-containing protein [Arthrobacter]|uniref:DUF5691 domain-containing protein n=2 Tax=Arthrobacter TaxID=1663 RepID=A0ABU9KK33_9MICC|nr:DUF5691 domain-containing protein [Arthrobacter sp. YJM1]MDP5225929.1 DUF5691 domain-containing protein [Arthrobacter sp. YJM1]